MNDIAGILAIRALNHWRYVYIPSYLGLRFFLRQVPESETSDFLEKFLLRKLVTRKSPRYRKFLRFKGRNEAMQIQYRSLYAASPSSALSEAYVLRTLSGIAGLRNRSYVYSYRWPKHERVGSSYSYFLPGYKERNRNVTALLQANPSYIVNVNDIRNFYPSADKEIITSRFLGHIDSTSTDENISYARILCEKVLDIDPEGIPVGPPLSHVFGNIALENVDAEMSKMIDNHYFRYVDDIFLVGESHEISEVKPVLNGLIESENLKFHSGKDDELSSQDWLENITSKHEESLGEKFNDLIEQIQLFLWWKPSRFNELQHHFRNAGMGLPLYNLALTAWYGRFHKYMQLVIKLARGELKILRRLEFENESNLLARASKLGFDFYAAAEKIGPISQLHSHSMVRRLRVQRLRFLLNRSLYLLPISQYENLLQLAPEVDEFVEFRSSIKAILDNTADPVLSLPGPAVSTFASLCREFNRGADISYNQNLLNEEGALDSVCILAAQGVISPPDHWINSLSDTDSEMVKFCMLPITESRMLADQSFEDELRTLQLGESRDVMDAILKTRFSDLEQANLEALLLDDWGGS